MGLFTTPWEEQRTPQKKNSNWTRGHGSETETKTVEVVTCSVGAEYTELPYRLVDSRI